MNEKKLNFSSKHIDSVLIEDADEYKIFDVSVIINISDKPLLVNDSEIIGKYASRILCNVVVKGDKFIKISTTGSLLNLIYDDSKNIEKSWSHVYDIFPLSHLKNTNLWRSEKQKIENIELNLWYAKIGTNCGIHNEHDFKELHTQIYGIGIMQKFHNDTMDSLYEDVYMSPGYTHKPFYDSKIKYPWHQYKAITDCIWLAIEIN